MRARDLAIRGMAGLAVLLGFFLPATGAERFYTLSPCRVVDTRQPGNAPALAPNMDRAFFLAGTCGIPASAVGVQVNLTLLTPPGPGKLIAFPEGSSAPNVTTVVVPRAGMPVISRGAIVSLSVNGALALRHDLAGSMHLVIDVMGYFD